MIDVALDVFAVDPASLGLTSEVFIRPHLRGWATPRKRPRRVAKKVAARGHRAHYDGGRALPAEAKIQRESRMSDLARRWCTEDVSIKVPDKIIGEREPTEDERMREHYCAISGRPPPRIDRAVLLDSPFQHRWGDRFPVIKPEPIPSPGPVDDGDFMTRTVRQETWVARMFGFECTIGLRWPPRRLAVRMKLLAPEDRLSEHEEIAGRLLERAAGRLFQAVAYAALSDGRRSTVRVLARQSSYRPSR